MKKTLIFFAILLMAHASFAQTESRTANQNAFNFLGGLGVSHEHALSQNNTLYLKASLVTTIGLSNASSGAFNAGINVGINAIGQYRHYYNFQKRLDKGLTINNNSGSYWALHAETVQGTLLYISPTTPARNTFCAGPVWGVQFSKSRLLGNVNLGAVGFYSDKTGTFTGEFNWPVQPIFRFSLGILLGKKDAVSK